MKSGPAPAFVLARVCASAAQAWLPVSGSSSVKGPCVRASLLRCGARGRCVPDPARTGLRGGCAGRLVREAMNRLQDLFGLLEVWEVSGFRDRLEPAVRE
jgi:hypothetical protein